MDRMLTIQRASDPISDRFGRITQTWATLVTLRAERLATRTADATGGAGAETDATETFRTYFTDLTLEDRIQFAGQTYKLKELQEIGRRRFLKIVCERIGP